MVFVVYESRCDSEGVMELPYLAFSDPAMASRCAMAHGRRIVAVEGEGSDLDHCGVWPVEVVCP